VLALITGGHGFVGKHLTGFLRKCGDEVVVTDISEGGPDLLDQSALNDFFYSIKPEVVYHLAGQADVGASWQSPGKTFRINAEGTLNVLLACRKAEVQRTLTISSAEVYGNVDLSELPIKESCPLSPVSPYAASKAAAEMISLQQANDGMEVMRARSFNHFGPGQSEMFVSSAFATRILRAQRSGEKSIPVGRLDTRRDFTDVRDVVRAYRSIMCDGVSGEAYNVCSGNDREIAELVNALLVAAKSDILLRPDPDLQRPSDIPVLRGDNEKIRLQTGWAPHIRFSQTIEDIIEAARSFIDADI
jgi:GDP-4-dehydro-6-deoxy-D-mannose reductase